MFATESSVWVSDYERATVTRFDPAAASPTVVTTVYGNPNAISVFGDSVWVAAHRGGTVTRLDEPSGAVVAEVKVGYTGRSGPQGVTATADAVWVGIPNTEAVVRVDPATNKVVATIPVVTSPAAASRRRTTRSGSRAASTTRRSSESTRERTRWSASFRSAGTTAVPSSSNGYPWFPVGNRLVQFDPATNEVDGVVEFADAFQGYGTAIGFGSVWVGSVGGRTLARVPLDVLENWATP